MKPNVVIFITMYMFKWDSCLLKATQLMVSVKPIFLEVALLFYKSLIILCFQLATGYPGVSTGFII